MGALAKQRGDVLGGERRVKIHALPGFAAQRKQRLGLRGRFNAFGRHPQSAGFAQADQEPHDSPQVSVGLLGRDHRNETPAE